MLCYCGSQERFSHCCQPYITGDEKVESAHLLMRSRFSAYASKNGSYLYNTYAKKTQQLQSETEIQQWANECEWLALVIHDFDEFNVDFSAYYLHNNRLCHLREISRFIYEVTEFETKVDLKLKPVSNSNAFGFEQWAYLDGEITEHEELKTIKRNDICPCNQFKTRWKTKINKKYKQCCGK
ncbi:MAG: YchJ family metal-binding protein [Colwellia sp.]